MPPRRSPAKRSRASKETSALATPNQTPRKSYPTSSSVEETLPTPPNTPSVSTLLARTKLTTDEWYKSSNTTKAYANYVKSGKTFLKDWAEEGRLSPAGQNDGPEDCSAISEAFDTIGSLTPIALKLLTAFKCDHQGKGFSTAEGLRSAFKLYFERVHGCQGNIWKFNSITQEWDGNPVFDPEFKVYFESLKNRDKRNGTSTQALPMLPKDLGVIMEFLDSSEAAADLGITKILYFKAFATTAFNLWTRNDELINLQAMHVTQNCVSPAGKLYHDIALIFRKTNKDQYKSQHYYIPPDLEHPEFDCHTHLGRWLDHLVGLLCRNLIGDDYIFPAIASTGLLKLGEPTSRSGIEVLLGNIVERSGVMQQRNGKFTTHCFRRGGAQYRFMWAERKWSLKAVKWWGGWSSAENVGTIMRYLLDELTTYEEGFSDILMDDRTSDRHENFMGAQTITATVSPTDLHIFGTSLIQQVRDIMESPTRALLPVSIPDIFDIQPTPPHTPEYGLCLLASGLPGPLQLQSSIQRQRRPPRIPKTTSLDDAVRYWEVGDEEKGLSAPLMTWVVTYEPAEYRSEAQKLSMIRIVRDEFVEHCARDYDVFEDQYPELRYQYTKLVKAVRTVRIARGDAAARRVHRL